MLLNEKLEEAIARTETLAGDAQAMLAILDQVDSWAAGLRESLVREGGRLFDVLDAGRSALEAQDDAVEAALREAAQDLGALAQSAGAAAERADALSARWRQEADAQVKAVVDTWREVEEQARKLDGAYTEAVEGCELLDVAVTEQMAAAGTSLEEYAEALDALARNAVEAVTGHVRELRDAERNAVAAVQAFTEGCEDALCAAGRVVYGVGDMVVRGHNDAVRALGDTSDDAPAGDAGVALRVIDQAPARAARFLEAARGSVADLQEGAELAAQAFGASASPALADLAADTLAAAAEVTGAAEAVPPPAC